MRTLELLPTPQNLSDTYINNTIDRNADLHYFIDMLDYIENSYSIALDGKWGSGKTFFVKQAKMIIDCFNDFIKTNIDNNDKIKDIWRASHNNEPDRILKPQVCIYYDAWENDNDEDPILSIIYEILQNINSDYSFSKGIDCINLFTSITELVSGLKISSLVKALRESNNPLSELKNNRSLKDKINDFLETILVEHGERLIIFIDELDRCKPSFAVKLLERIKHYFNNDKITFVFSINTLELQNTIKQNYGNNFDACKYLDRFFDLRINIPKANLNKFYTSIGFNNEYHIYDIIVSILIEKYHFQLREISKFVLLSQAAAYKQTHDILNNYRFRFAEQKALKLCIYFVVPLMIALKMYDITLYYDFIEGRNPTPLLELLQIKVFEEEIVSYLLTDRESIDSCDNGKTLVLLSDKINELYNALFIHTNELNSRKTVGSLVFTKETASEITRISSMLSKYTDFEYGARNDCQ